MEEVREIALNENTIATLDTIVETVLGSDKATVTLRDRASGEILYSYRGEHLMRPASNMKIITGAAALSELGLDFRFKTELYMDGQIEDGTLYGDVYIKGYGDPTINEATLKLFAQKLSEQGIQKITGMIIGDDTYFTGDTLPPGVDEEGETHYYGARISPITMSPNDDFDASTIIVEVTARNIGEQPDYVVIPHLSGMQIFNEALTVVNDKENTLEIRRINNTDQIKITGEIPEGETAKVWVSLQDPTKNTLQFFKVLCEQVGIDFSEECMIASGVIPQQAERIYTHESQTLEKMFSIFMKLSNNSMADIFVKTMGKLQHGEGDYMHGLQVVQAYLEKHENDFTAWQFVDGSGLSHGIRIHSNGISQLLFKLQKEPYFPQFFASLPVAGNTDRLIGGTLKDRFLEPELQNRIFAKTGYIHEVNTLSGYVTGESGHDYIFSIMLEGREEGIPFLDSGLKEMIACL
ncbi:D-alanyl-D-alanine carboxypeptidase/D-alanyl-D-alanine-endopeptidase [Solibacillus sp. A46]|uniref:D-alanyl-D-alanine carboxypeptidase/D-alanyl-D-alanine-endopeptidase n=1 Tax=Solibacillus faecavium TaxID=2762221 RepID=A0ABR8Y2U7_9BACL|nr:D-alanyl-D-alanine carboxypeptidase/D-alanyl-D-alanine-endopeptidase [Solibacillus faecavium]MBD8038549.1 D-alanyl-D-alanine carboxypeptidase/D-alanyl-D-alanine-endopeptidase [Solibacillus faecavium]